MDCGIPFCHTACPVNNLIPDWNDLVTADDWQRPTPCAGWTVRDQKKFFKGRVEFHPKEHDDGPKRVLGTDIPASQFAGGDNIVDPLRVARFFAEGATVIFSHLEGHVPALAGFCTALCRMFSSKMQTNIYLTPPRAQVPEGGRSQLALARVYAESGRAEEASEIAERILAREPANTEARSVAGSAAVTRNAVPRAEELLRDGRASGADELQMALLDARIARARRDQPRARAALEEAARLRGDQLRAGG